MAGLAGVKRLVAFHHDPDHEDQALDALYADAGAGCSFAVVAAKEGTSFTVGG